MAKLIKGYYKDGVWHEYGGKLYDTIGYNTNGSMTQKAISDTLGGVLELISGYSMAIRVHGDASVTNLNPFYFVTDGESFTITITYNQPAIALNVISIIMDGTDITQEAYQDGVISIDRVTGNVVITVETASVTDTNMFTRRTTANGISILNNKALLKGIKGNSMNFYQKLVNPDFNDGDTSWEGRSGYGNTISVTDGILTATSNANYDINVLQESIFTEAHIYLCIAKVRLISGPTGYNVRFGNANNSYNGAVLAELNKWYTTSYVLNFSNGAPTTTGNKWFMLKYQKSSTIEVDWAQCIDLTRLLGSQSANISYNTFHKLFPLDVYNRGSIVLNNSMTNYVSKDGNEETLQNVSLNVPTLTGKLNGEGESVAVFPNGMKSSCNEAVNDTYDEIKQVDGVWTAIKRIGTERATNAISDRYEYEILAEEEVYVLDDQTIPTEITVEDQGVEEILPTNGATPTTAPAIMEIQYGSIPSRGLLGGLLGGTKGGSDENEPQEEETEEEPIEGTKESPAIDEKQELKK